MRQWLTYGVSAYLAFFISVADDVQAATPVVAVFTLESKRAPLKKADLAQLSDYIGATLAGSGRYQVVPQDQLKAALRQQKAESYKQCYAESCQIEIGKELAAEKSLAGTVAKLGKNCIVTLKLFDLRKSTQENAGTAKGKCNIDAVLVSIDQALTKLTGTSKPQTASQTTPTASKAQTVPLNTAKVPNLGAQGGAVAFFDATAFKKNNREAREIEAKLKRENEQLQAQVRSEAKEIERLSLKYSTASGSEKQKLMTEIQNEQQQLASKINNLQAEHNKLTADAERQLEVLFSNELSPFAHRHDMRFLLNPDPEHGVLYYEDSANCTEEIQSRTQKSVCAQNKNAVVAFVDMQRALLTSDAGRQAKLKMQAVHQKKQAQLNQSQQLVMQKKEEGMQAYQEALAQLQAQYQTMQKEMADMEAKLVKKAMKPLLETIKSFARKRGFSMILDSQKTLMSDNCTKALKDPKQPCRGSHSKSLFFLDAQSVLRNSIWGTRAKKQLLNRKKAHEAMLDQEKKKFKLLSPSDLRKKFAELQQKKEAFNQEYQREEQKLTSEIFKKIKAEVKSFAQAQGASAILDYFPPYAHPSADLTSKFMARFNQKYP